MEQDKQYISESDLINICLNCRHFIHGTPERKHVNLSLSDDGFTFDWFLCGPNSSSDTIINVNSKYRNEYLMGCTNYLKIIEGSKSMEGRGVCPLKVEKKEDTTVT